MNFENTISQLRPVFKYDGLGRLRRRTTYINNTLMAQTSYIYDGMRVIQERDVNNTPEVSYTRGTDLSGTLEEAGGIGGLLARSHGYSSGTWSTHNHYHADGNGNVTYLVNSSQTVAASYRYDAYGNTISSSGSLASSNVYRFSSKESVVIDMYASTDRLYYYGYRFYDPNLQRWLNRDPLGERGGESLYAFVSNSPIMRVDPWGLDSVQVGPAVPCDAKLMGTCQADCFKKFGVNGKVSQCQMRKVTVSIEVLPLCSPAKVWVNIRTTCNCISVGPTPYPPNN